MVSIVDCGVELGLDFGESRYNNVAPLLIVVGNVDNF
jgi:hypothetical protein